MKKCFLIILKAKYQNGNIWVNFWVRLEVSKILTACIINKRKMSVPTNHPVSYMYIHFQQGFFRIAEEVMKGICRHSKVLGRFYHKNYPYTTGSHWDKLTVGDTRQECDVNVIFNVGFIFSSFLIFGSFIINGWPLKSIKWCCLVVLFCLQC